MAVLLPPIRSRYFDRNGRPLVGGKLFVYFAGTTIPTNTYKEYSATTLNTNPIILDSRGEADIWLKPGNYKFVLKDSSDVVQVTIDNVRPADGGGGGMSDVDYAYDGWSLRFNEQFTSTGLGDTLEKIIKMGYIAPAVSLSGSSNILREKGDSVASSTLTATITKKSDPIVKVEMFRGATSIYLEDPAVAPGSSTVSYTDNNAFSDNRTYSVQVTDSGATGGPSTITATTTYSFVYPYYFGVGAAGLGAAVSGLTKDIITSNANLTKNFSPNGSQKMYFAYPASYGVLTKIYDVNNFDTILDWTRTTVNITGLDATAQSYYVYEFNNYAVSGTYPYRFVR